MSNTQSIQDIMNTIILGDALKATKELPSECIDLIIIDPPYVQVVNSGWDNTEVVTSELVRELLRILKPTGSLYLWCGIGEKSQSLMRWWPIFSKHFVFKDLITWKKTRGIGMRRGWLYTREEICWFVKDNKQFIWNEEHQYSDERRIRDDGKDFVKPSQNGSYAKSLYKRLTNIWTDIQEESFNIHTPIKHTTPKPIKALKRIIEAHTDQGDIVYDCFMGSGSTAVACILTDRNYIGVEINSDIRIATIQRINKTKIQLSLL